MQEGARIVEGAVDALVFLPDPMKPHSREADFRALIRVALLADIPFALSPASADHLARGMSAAEDEGGTAAVHGATVREHGPGDSGRWPGTRGHSPAKQARLADARGV